MNQKPGHFFVERLKDGRYAAASVSAPYFCFRAASEEAVIARVRTALIEYGEFRNLGHPQIIEASAPEVTLTPFRAPRKVDFSEVCAAI